MKKAQAAKQLDNSTYTIRTEIENFKNIRRDALEGQKQLQMQLIALQGGKSRVPTSTAASTLHANSSGRVVSASRAKGKARTAAEPHPLGELHLQTE